MLSLKKLSNRASEFLWLGVAWVFTDCVVSVQLWRENDLDGSLGKSNLAEKHREQGLGSSSHAGSRGGGSISAVLVDKLSLRLFRFDRGELVVLRSPDDPRRRLVRRLIGLEGDWVSVVGGKVEHIPKGGCWVEADGGLQAAGGDSRMGWGPVPLALIEGRASRVLWPPRRWGALSPQLSTSGTRLVGRSGSLEFLTPPDQDDWWA